MTALLITERDRIRKESYGVVEQTMRYGSTRSVLASSIPQPTVKDTRTEVQKRFDAIAEELEEEKGAPTC